jgi:murein DD-endopeptidase MepM/ murein hydrolase activator NlpD
MIRMIPGWINRPPKNRKPWLPIAAGASLIFLGVGLLWIAKHRHVVPALPLKVQALPVVVSTGTIGVDGSLSQSLGLAGVRPIESAQVQKTLNPLFNVRHSNPKDHFEITLSTTGHLLQLVYWPNSFEYFTVTRSSAGLFSATSGKVPVEGSVVGINGRIQGSLWDAMKSQGVPPEMIVRFAELFGWRIDFLTEPRLGDQYSMVWKRSYGNGAERDENILAASYTGRESGTLCAYPLAGEYYDAEGNSLRGEFLRAPLVYRRISSYFTEHRYHPILKIYRPHHGIDYAAPYGTPASSIADGVVISKGWEGGLGNELRVRHTGSYVSIYGHLKSYARNIHIGSHVKQGQVIGYVGSTGLSTGPHLHFGFERDGHLINFFSLKMKNSRKTVPSPERQHFEEIKKQAQTLFAQLLPGKPIQMVQKEGTP